MKLSNQINLLTRNNYKAPSAFTNNALATDILYFFAKQYNKINSFNYRIGISIHNFESYKIKCEKNENCIYCGLQNE